MFDPQRPARGYQLIWPRELFRSELAALLQPGALVHGGMVPLKGALHLLVEEALLGPDPTEDVARLIDTSAADEWAAVANQPAPRNRAREFGEQLLVYVDELHPHIPPRYYLDRQTDPSAQQANLSSAAGLDVVGGVEFQYEWAALVADLRARGYLERRTGSACTDDDADPDTRLNELVNVACGMDPEFPKPVYDEGYTPEGILTLIEVIHDLVDRPRTRSWHDFDHHYWYFDFDEHAGQAVYRWRVNRLLADHRVGLQLSDIGSDLGRVVERSDDAREDLIRRTTSSAPDGDDNVRRTNHAVLIFRDRHSTPDDKRRACRELADVLESRRAAVLKNSLVRKDEDDLFRIANQFAIRHHNDAQQRDYDPAFLDWIFWCFLAAVELSNQLIEKATKHSVPTGIEGRAY